MSGYTALKPLSLNGDNYVAGDIIPEEAIVPSRISILKRTGYIAPVLDTPVDGAELAPVAQEGEIGVSLPINTENGTVELVASESDLAAAFTVLQMKSDDIPAAIKTLESENALIIIDALTKAQAVKKAARARAQELAAGGGENE